MNILFTLLEWWFPILMGLVGLFFVYIWGKIKGQVDAIKDGYITKGGKLYFVLDWPKADKDSWVKFMSGGWRWDIHAAEIQELGEIIGVNIPSVSTLAYLDEWTEYEEQRKKEGQNLADAE